MVRFDNPDDAKLALSGKIYINSNHLFESYQVLISSRSKKAESLRLPLLTDKSKFYHLHQDMMIVISHKNNDNNMIKLYIIQTN